MKQIKAVMLAIMASGALVTQARAGFTYVWTTIPGAGPVTGGDSEWAGTIVLDTSASTDGTLADIISVSLTTPQGNFTFDPTSNIGLFFGGVNFTWNASQIESMYFGWQVYPLQPSIFEDVGYGPGGLQVNSLVGPLGSFDEDGSWLAASAGGSEPGAGVPEPPTWTTMLMGITGLVLVSYRRMRKSSMRTLPT